MTKKARGQRSDDGSPPAILYMYLSDPDRVPGMKRNLRKHKVPEPIIAEIVKEFPSTNLISACQFKLSRVGDLNDLFDVIPSIKKPKMESVEAHLRRVLKRNVSQAEVKESFERQLRR